MSKHHTCKHTSYNSVILWVLFYFLHLFTSNNALAVSSHAVVMQLAQAYGNSGRHHFQWLSTKILCSSFIWRRHKLFSKQEPLIRMEFVIIQGHNVAFKCPPDWTWSLWLSLGHLSCAVWSSETPESAICQQSFCTGFLNNISSSAWNIVEYKITSQMYFFALPECFSTTTRLTWSQCCWFSFASCRAPSRFRGLLKADLKVG